MANINSFFSKLFKKTIDTPLEVEKEEVPLENEITIQSPIKGSILPLEEMKDEVFSQGMMGKGVAIIPSEGKVYSPVTGTISTVLPTKHAIGLIDRNNAQILIHVGTDTVKLNGKYYKVHVKDGQLVKAGELILEFDMDKIKAAGYEVVTPVIITNSDDFSDIIVTNATYVNVKEELLTLVR